MSDSRILDQQSPRAAGTDDPALRFGEGARSAGTWRGRRLLFLDEQPAFALSFWCGTCPFLFQRLEGANQTLSITALQQRLDDGLQAVDDDIIASLSMLLPAGEYLPMLEQLQPRLVMPMRPGDYFSEDQVATWGIDAFWGLPRYPRTPYYRARRGSSTQGLACTSSSSRWSRRTGTMPAWSRGTRASCGHGSSDLPGRVHP